ncbi:hypothetical protein L873DRAFT_1699283 [Choiromyces venosus 120613-1]|uniref:Uncharacterized protein n=1 Tax=Choiromyces venosus 120613-1 TaxID=1336337 RepID=A0A3N4JF94_9PEZI|nr:hypothetical protein L873DRAFT_1699283 [Choiromyces venosus 120613-1]
MPPQRTLPPAKAVKTERTHEENQERAYIAASRRSDRSLEARIESARRASAIHKRRTGRALRVTEQDVINEEMYEEEEDEYYGYRGLTAHLRNGSQDWNRRLQAYLQSQYVMRSALSQAMSVDGGNPSQYPGIQGTYQSSYMQQPMAGPYVDAPIHSSHMSPTTYASLRQQPYPSPAAGQQRYQRAMSMQMSQPQPIHLQSYQQGIAYGNQPVFAPSSTPAGLSLNTLAGQYPPQIMPNHQTGMMPQQFNPQVASQSPKTNTPLSFGDSLATFPFTTALPPETQQFLQPALDPNDPLYPALMAGHSNTPFFGFNNGANDLKSSISEPAPSVRTTEIDPSPPSFSPLSSEQTTLDCSTDSQTLNSLFDSSAVQTSSPLEQTPISPVGNSVSNDTMFNNWVIDDESLWN